ncbi:formate dehydrogenase subunit alpha [Saccharolobus solfataricus]|uniref:Formate dehydrogenase subunit alpha n=1 Tax=Saccharolobus solfataricus TaxID=2287 RepID=A0A7S9NPX6_SACSO|nr:formate dehydrogenase subunit alpha [Saccharolobus solfataricus]QPG48597.1 formate dehydrogenase subunit alpha [Saccharolobus solfataricus]
MEIRKTICPFCGVGCGLEFYVENNFIFRVSPSQEHIISRGHVCGKGAVAPEVIYAWDRLTYPLKRVKDTFIRVTWDEAIYEIANKLKDIKSKYGPETIAFYGGCQNTLEEGYSFMKLARALGSNNVDSCARVCHEPSALALKEMIGIGASSVAISEMLKARNIVISGESITDSHPVLSQYLVEAKRNGAKIIVIDPRLSGTARIADLFLQINVGTDIYLYNAVANYLISNGLYDRKFVEDRVENFEEFREFAKSYSIEEASRITGVNEEKIMEFAKIIANKPTILSWGLGLTQSGGVNAVKSYINLALLTGNVGIDGGGLLVYRGQVNVQGSGDLIKPDVFPNGPMNEENRKALSEVWGFAVPIMKGLSITEAFLRDNNIKAVILMNYNPAFSLPNREKVIKFLKSLELLVVMDPFMTETAKYAHYILPTPLWAEKEGSVVNLDRAVKWRFKVIDPPGEVKSELWIVKNIAEKLGFTGFYKDPRLVFKEIKKVAKLYSNLTLDELMDYSVNSRYPNHESSLYKDKFMTPSGKAMFGLAKYAELYGDGFILITGRVVTRYNSDELIKRIPGYRNYNSDLLVNPNDASKLGIKDGDMVKVISKCGMVILKAKVTNEIKAGHVFAYMHDFYVNNVVCDNLDEISKTPRYKITLVKIEKLG